MNQIFCNVHGDNNLSAKTCFICDGLKSSHNARGRKKWSLGSFYATVSWAIVARKHSTWFLKLPMKNSLLRMKLNCNENIAKQSTNTRWKCRQSQNIHVEVNIFARQKSKDRSRVWIVQNNLYIAETYTKGTCTKIDGNFVAKLKLHTPSYTRPCVYRNFVHDGPIGIR